MHVAAGDTATSKITVGKDGEISGAKGLYLESAATVINAGYIHGDGSTSEEGIHLGNSAAKFTITNYGLIDTLIHAGVSGDAGTLSLSNSSRISGASVTVTSGATIANSAKGDLGFLFLDGAAATISNAGRILGATLGSGADKLTNAGTVTGDINM